MEVYLISCNVIDKGTMLLQNCMDFVRIEPGSDSETYPTSSRDGNPMIDVKVEEGPIPITSKCMKAEHEVSCMSVCPLLGTFHRYAELCTVFLISICPHETSSLY
jgi:hypothetical protein